MRPLPWPYIVSSRDVRFIAALKICFNTNYTYFQVTHLLDFLVLRFYMYINLTAKTRYALKTACFLNLNEKTPHYFLFKQEILKTANDVK